MIPAASALLPEVRVAGHALHFFCELHEGALMGAFATCCTWLELTRRPPQDLVDGSTEEQCYQWAAARTAKYQRALGQREFRVKALATLEKEFFSNYGFAQLRWALQQHFRHEQHPVSTQ